MSRTAVTHASAQSADVAHAVQAQVYHLAPADPYSQSTWSYIPESPERRAGVSAAASRHGLPRSQARPSSRGRYARGGGALTTRHRRA